MENSIGLNKSIELLIDGSGRRLGNKEHLIKRKKVLALKVLGLSHDILSVDLRFMAEALYSLKLKEEKIATMTIRDNTLSFNPDFILETYKAEEEAVARGYLHVLFHCIFKHPLIDSMVKKNLWDLACDIAVENIINDLRLPRLIIKKSSEQRVELEELEEKIKILTAEKIYRYFLSVNLPSKEIDRLNQLFLFDDHRTWYLAEENLRKMDGIDTFGNIEWDVIAKKIDMELKTFSKLEGFDNVALTQNLKEMHREKVDYEAFLKKFAVLGEVMEINDEEFDYIFYSYGLKIYGNMPLIEPLEQKEKKVVKEFVIAIDTSGSTAGGLVQQFLQKTYNILLSTESFYSKVNILIIQCDTKIQDIVRIKNLKEIEHYIKNMRVKGRGGTDFRPVFSYVDDLIDAGFFFNLQGLIYFTDGYGKYPAYKTNYRTAFVFLADAKIPKNFPPWAMKIVLDKNQLLIKDEYNEY